MGRDNGLVTFYEFVDFIICVCSICGPISSIWATESGPQHSVCRSPGSGQAHCISWRNFAPFTTSTITDIHASARA